MTRFRSKLALGAANFGLNYGIANKNGKLETDEIAKILNLANTSGIEIIDTAQAYGDSEQRLGPLHQSRFDIITKIGVGLDKTYSDNLIKLLVTESLTKLSLDYFNAVLLHRPELLFGPDSKQIILELNSLKEKGLAQKIGISIYSPEVLEKITKMIDLDIVQAPFNVFDQRILKSGWVERLKEKGIEVHTRSIFLQGLLLMQKSELPIFFKENWARLFEDWFEFQFNVGADGDKIALDFGLQHSWIDKIIVGVDSVRQLERLLQIEVAERYLSMPRFDVDDLDLIDPSKWRVK
jgi:aryl-alcohol dehydrogenase-like predicted oxidoreductase